MYPILYNIKLTVLYAGKYFKFPILPPIKSVILLFMFPNDM